MFLKFFLLFFFCGFSLAADVTYPASYSNTKAITSKVQLSWELVDTQQVDVEDDLIAFKLETNLNGWIGVGFNPDDVGMKNADMKICTFDGINFVVDDYWSNGTTTPIKDTLLGGTNDLVLWRGGQNEGTWMEFIMPVWASSRDPYDNTLFSDKLNKIVWAFGTNASELVYHGLSRGYVLLDLFGNNPCLNGCNGHGQCKDGVCYCLSQWSEIDCSTVVPSSTIFPTSYKYYKRVDPSYTLFWKPVTFRDVPSISILVQSSNPGWIGIGFNPSDRGMLHCDMVIATIDDDKVTVGDYWSSKKGKPVLDTMMGGTSDVYPLGGRDNGGTWMEFIRALDTGDDYDRPISTNNLTKVTWAYGSNEFLSIHNTTSRGFLWVDFFFKGGCPNGCSGTGSCKKGVCLCDDGWEGDDCSIVSYSPSLFPSSLPQTISLDSSLTLSWGIFGSDIAFSIHRTDGRGWVGLSFGSDDGMTKADMLIATIKNEVVVVDDYWSTSFSAPISDITLGGGNSVKFYQGTILDGEIIVEVIRPLKAEDKYDKDISDKGNMQVAYAFGNTDSLTKHLPSDRKSLTIDFSTGIYSQPMSFTYALRMTHGILMYLSWGVLLFGGALFARYYRNADKQIRGIPAWFFVHRITQYTGFVLAIVAWVIALIMVTSHYKTLYHGQLGTLLICLIVFQVFVAFYRPHPPEKNQRKSTIRLIFEYQHVWVGRLALLVSIPAIWSGLEEIGAPLALRGAYLASTFFVILTAFSFDLYTHLSYYIFKPQSEELQSLNFPHSPDEVPPPRDVPPPGDVPPPPSLVLQPSNPLLSSYLSDVHLPPVPPPRMTMTVAPPADEPPPPPPALLSRRGPGEFSQQGLHDEGGRSEVIIVGEREGEGEGEGEGGGEEGRISLENSEKTLQDE